MLSTVDDFLNRTTMYRMLVYYLCGLLAVATLESALGYLPYNPLYLLASTAFLIAVAWLTNALFSSAWKVPANTESSLITALILALIITPQSPAENIWFLLCASILAMASKYILTIGGKHVFNPAALAVALTPFILLPSASWWIGGNLATLPYILVGGFLVVRKLKRWDLVLTFILTATLASMSYASLAPVDLGAALLRTLKHTPILFFAFVMITEPLTTPPRQGLRILYGALVGLLFAPWVHLASIYSTPELALIMGNIFSFAVSPRFKSLVTLQEIKKLANETSEFIFESPHMDFRPGQYAEFTLPVDNSDARGNRRYFTIASSPNEEKLSLGIKFYPQASRFKKTFARMSPGETLLASSIAGDFILPTNLSTKIVYIAGGIGITPFRSMIKHQHDIQEVRDGVLFYSNNSESEIAYREIFDAAVHADLGFRVVYTLTGEEIPEQWRGEQGHINANMITKYAPDYKERTFYISGPRSMVNAFKKTLRTMGIPRHKIKTDFFPGFA